MNGLPFLILLVDDDPDDRMMIDEAFVEIGHVADIKKFASGEQLLKYLDEIDDELLPSLIVMDNSLPKKDASEIIKILKADSRYKRIPVIIYSSSMSPYKQEQLMSLGALECIEKGTGMNDLLNAAQKFVRVAEDHQKIR